jgi:hypothetical protein
LPPVAPQNLVHPMRLRLDGDYPPDVQLQLADVGNATDAHAAGAATITKEPVVAAPPVEARRPIQVRTTTTTTTTTAAAAAAADNLLVILSKSPVGGPGPRDTRMAAIQQTWGQMVPVVFLTLNATLDAELLARRGAANARLWQLPPEDHAERFKQARAMQFAFTRVAADYPNVRWIFWGNDHTFVIPGNLRCLLAQHDPGEFKYLGHRLYGPCCGTFNSGAAGFALSERAFRTLVTHWREAGDRGILRSCDFSRKGAEIAPCLKELTDGACVPLDTRDPEDGGEKFHLYGPIRVAKGAIDDWAKRKKAALDPPERFPDPPSSACCARHTATFHYVAADETRVLHAAFHGMRPADRAALTSAGWAEKWPASRRLGGYSAPWPGRRPADAAIVIEVLGKKIQALSYPHCGMARDGGGGGDGGGGVNRNEVAVDKGDHELISFLNRLN